MLNLILNCQVNTLTTKVSNISLFPKEKIDSIRTMLRDHRKKLEPYLLKKEAVLQVRSQQVAIKQCSNPSKSVTELVQRISHLLEMLPSLEKIWIRPNLELINLKVPKWSKTCFLHRFQITWLSKTREEDLARVREFKNIIMEQDKGLLEVALKEFQV